MNLVPFRSFNSLVDDVEQHFQKIVDNFFKPESLGDLKNKFRNSGYPKIDSYVKDGAYVIQATVPGVNPDDLVIEVLDCDNRESREKECKCVRLSGKLSETYQVDDANWMHKEMHRREFSRTLTLPDNVEGDPEARIKDGIVTLTWKTKQTESDKSVKRITLKVEE